MKKALSFLMAMAMVLTMLTVPAMAATATGITPADGTTDVCVLDDVVVTFDGDITQQEADALTITVDPAAEYTVTANGAEAIIYFENGLAYGTEYTVTVGDLSTTFTTEADEKDIIFYEDFQGDTDASAAKFSLFGTNGASTTDIPYSFSTGGKLAFSFDPDERSSLNARNMSNATPRVAIAGSKNWTKYKIEYDFTVGNYLCANFLMLGVADDTTGGAGVTFGYPNANYAGFYARYDGLPDTNINYSAMSEAANEATVYHHEAIVDPTVSLVSTVTNNTTGAEIFSLTVDSSTQYSTVFLPTMTVGNVVLAGNTNRTTFDNIKVTDLSGFTYTVADIKDVNPVVMTFTKDLDESAFSSSYFTAVDEYGNAATAVAELTASNEVTLTIPAAVDGVIYEITAGAGLAAADGSVLAGNKTTEIVGAEADTGSLVCSISQTMAGTPASVLTDLLFDFGTAVDISEVSTLINITPAASYTLVEAATGVKMVFDEALAFDTEYTASYGTTTYTFSTEGNDMDLLFFEDFTDMTASAARFEQYGAAGTFSAREYWGTKATSGPSLYIGGTHSANDGSYYKSFTTDIGRPAIIGSDNWKDIKVEYDYAINPSRETAVLLRATEDNGTYAGITFQSGFGSTGGLYGAKNQYSGTSFSNVTNWIGAEAQSGIDLTAGNAAYANQHVEIILKDSTMSAKLWDKDGNLAGVLADTAVTHDVPGKVVFTAGHGQNAIDNIKVTDLGFTFVPESIKNVPGEIVLTFEETLNPATFSSDLITVTNEDGEPVEVAAAVTGDLFNQITITLIDAVDGIYDITVDSALQDRNGNTMAADKTFFASVVMPYSVSENTIGSILPNQKVTASVEITQNEALSQTYTYVLAVYDANGVLYTMGTGSVSLSAAGNELLRAETVKALPEDITGFTAVAFVVDDLENIKPLSKSVRK